SLEPKLNPAVVSAVRGADGWIRPLREGNLDRFGSIDRAAQASNAAVSPFFSLYDSALPTLKSLVEARASALQNEMIRNLAIGFVVLALVGVFVVRVTGKITGQIHEINDAFSLIGTGNYDVRVPVVSKDELGSMAMSMNAVLDNTLTLIQSREER